MQVIPLHAAPPAADIAEQADSGSAAREPVFLSEGHPLHFDSGVLTLRGTVPLWQLRQFAESIVARVEGVREVVNQVEVFDPMLP